MGQHWWTEEQDGRLTELVKQGRSASQIGAVLRISRNAVIGRCHRIGLLLGNKGFADRILVARLGERYEQGVARKQLAIEFNTTEYAVTHALTKLHKKGLGYRPRPRVRYVRGGPRRPSAPKTVPKGVDFGTVTLRDLPCICDAARPPMYHCRYISGEVNGADTLYCGAQALDNACYCAEHWKLTHVPAATVHPD